MLMLSILSSLLHISKACQSIPLYYGTLDASLTIPGGTFTSMTSSCQCCGLCHQDKRCKSLSFNPQSGKCTLYSKVGGYPEFSRVGDVRNKTMFYIMPYSSTTGEFCLRDDDCLTGEPCRAKMCTTDTTITCLDIKELNPAGAKASTYWGAVNGTEMRLGCGMKNKGGGWTLLVNSPSDHDWLRQDVLSLNSAGDGDMIHSKQHPYSALWAADHIRDSRAGDYRVIVRSQGAEVVTYNVFLSEKGPKRGVVFKAPRAQSLLGSTPVDVPYNPDNEDNGFSFSDGQVSFPYMLNQHGVVYHMNTKADTDIGGIMRSYQTSNERWAVDAYNPKAIRVLIKEGQ